MERKCPRCGSLAARVGSNTSTLMSWNPYYDKDGNYHNDDPNIHTTYYTCSECGQNYSIETRYGKSELKWKENDVNQLGDLFYNSTPSIGEDLVLINLDAGSNMIGENNLILTNEGTLIKPDIFKITTSKTKLTIGNGLDIEIVHNNKTYTIDLDLLLQFLAAQGMIKES